MSAFRRRCLNSTCPEVRRLAGSVYAAMGRSKPLLAAGAAASSGVSFPGVRSRRREPVGTQALLRVRLKADTTCYHLSRDLIIRS